MVDYIQVTLTLNSHETAKHLARSIIEARLAACAQVSGPIHSTFWWQGGIREVPEWHCFIKTTTDNFQPLEQFINEHYPADTPEIIAVPIVVGSAAYLQWIHEEASPSLEVSRDDA